MFHIKKYLLAVCICFFASGASAQETATEAKIREANRIADAFVAYVDSLHAELFAAAGGPAPGRPDTPKDIRNKEITTRLFVEEGKGEELKTRIEQTRAALIGLAPRSKRKALSKKMPLLIEPLPRHSSARNWVEYKFKQMPVAAVFPILGKLRADARTSAELVIQSLRNN